MAIFHCSVKTIKRSAGRTATASAAYRAGEAITDERSGIQHDYRRRVGVADTFMLLPAGAPEKLFNRANLWNAAEKAERRKDAVVAREMILALPYELSPKQRRTLVERMGLYLVYQLGVAVDVAIHDPSWRRGHDVRNFHTHLLFTSRVVNANGLGEKTRVMDTRPSGPQMIHAMRQAWEDFTNEALAAAGLNVRVDRRTLQAQGIFDRVAQIHKGPGAVAMHDEDKEMESQTRKAGNGRKIDYTKIDDGRSRIEFNGEIIDLNELRAGQGPLPLEVQIRNIEALIEILLEKVTDLEALIPRNLLPEWVRRKVERAWWRAVQMVERQIYKKKEAERRQKERKGTHERMHRIREQLKALEKEKKQKQSLQRLYTRIEVVVAMRPPLVFEARRPMPVPMRELTSYQYGIELKFKAEKARAAVPPEYRPRIEQPVTAALVPAGKGILPQAMPTALPKDNGGQVLRPPSIRRAFNVQADPVPIPYKQQIKINFGPR